MQTSRFEGKCLAVREAKILGKAIISTNFEAIYSEIENEKNGIIVQMNVNSIYEALASLIEDNQKREYLRNNISASKESGILEYEHLFDKILGMES